MAQIQSGYLIDAANLINAFNIDAVSSTGPQGNGTNAAYVVNSTVNFADSIVWGPGSGTLPAQYPPADNQEQLDAWIAVFGGNGRSGSSTGNAWATANVVAGDFKKTYPSDPSVDYVIFASHYSGNGLPSSTAVLYQSARNFLTVNWCRATKNIIGGGSTVYGPFKASFATPQYDANFLDPITPRGFLDADAPGSLANATYAGNEDTSNPTDQEQWGINNYFNSLKKSFNNRPITEVSITVCHVSCHSSCHSSRGRR
jgi:hypothetical protein